MIDGASVDLCEEDNGNPFPSFVSNKCDNSRFVIVKPNKTFFIFIRAESFENVKVRAQVDGKFSGFNNQIRKGCVSIKGFRYTLSDRVSYYPFKFKNQKIFGNCDDEYSSEKNDYDMKTLEKGNGTVLVEFWQYIKPEQEDCFLPNCLKAKMESGIRTGEYFDNEFYNQNEEDISNSVKGSESVKWYNQRTIHTVADKLVNDIPINKNFGVWNSWNKFGQSDNIPMRKCRHTMQRSEKCIGKVKLYYQTADCLILRGILNPEIREDQRLLHKAGYYRDMLRLQATNMDKNSIVVIDEATDTISSKSCNLNKHSRLESESDDGLEKKQKKQKTAVKIEEKDSDSKASIGQIQIKEENNPVKNSDYDIIKSDERIFESCDLTQDNNLEVQFMSSTRKKM